MRLSVLSFDLIKRHRKLHHSIDWWFFISMSSGQSFHSFSSFSVQVFEGKYNEKPNGLLVMNRCCQKYSCAKIYLKHEIHSDYWCWCRSWFHSVHYVVWHFIKIRNFNCGKIVAILWQKSFQHYHRWVISFLFFYFYFGLIFNFEN